MAACGQVCQPDRCCPAATASRTRSLVLGPGPTMRRAMSARAPRHRSHGATRRIPPSLASRCRHGVRTRRARPPAAAACRSQAARTGGAAMRHTAQRRRLRRDKHIATHSAAWSLRSSDASAHSASSGTSTAVAVVLAPAVAVAAAIVSLVLPTKLLCPQACGSGRGTG